MDKLWPEVEAFVRKEAGVSARKLITPLTSLEDDLDITGDDAGEFMVRFFEHFRIEVGDYDFNRYFLTEGSGVALLFTMFSKKRRESLKRVPLTVGMLVNAVRLKRWDSSQIELLHDT
ncbi:DUF1493 family protein [Paraburkholderia lacunae]|uniref:DUF1493 domain-containing protein n=1 Tax=Paraburkholderia lacunae TaxID=2211104 RepID=A0A370NFN8_9BURK|nr:DUF1493 family protein [Paraburkholderia lacunae]RDK04432.1 hypothetical protein DLM46_00715 [Paraburkholderia lacunae]